MIEIVQERTFYYLCFVFIPPVACPFFLRFVGALRSGPEPLGMLCSGILVTTPGILVDKQNAGSII